MHTALFLHGFDGERWVGSWSSSVVRWRTVPLVRSDTMILTYAVAIHPVAELCEAVLWCMKKRSVLDHPRTTCWRQERWQSSGRGFPSDLQHCPQRETRAVAPFWSGFMLTVQNEHERTSHGHDFLSLSCGEESRYGKSNVFIRLQNPSLQGWEVLHVSSVFGLSLASASLLSLGVLTLRIMDT